jgi:DnaJ-class molecular chaperone
MQPLHWRIDQPAGVPTLSWTRGPHAFGQTRMEPRARPAEGRPMKPQTWLILIGLGLLWAGGYALACRVWPTTSCKKCEGTGKHRSPSGKNWRKCRRCKGSGSRKRTGLLILTKLHVIKEEAK